MHNLGLQNNHDRARYYGRVNIDKTKELNINLPQKPMNSRGKLNGSSMAKSDIHTQMFKVVPTGETYGGTYQTGFIIPEELRKAKAYNPKPKPKPKAKTARSRRGGQPKVGMDKSTWTPAAYRR
jgi:hypothetical protein